MLRPGYSGPFRNVGQFVFRNLDSWWSGPGGGPEGRGPEGRG